MTLEAVSSKLEKREYKKNQKTKNINMVGLELLRKVAGYPISDTKLETDIKISEHVLAYYQKNKLSKINII